MILRSPLMSGKKIALMSGCADERQEKSAHEREPLMISICNFNTPATT
jgi:hypothetical protein